MTFFCKSYLSVWGWILVYKWVLRGDVNYKSLPILLPFIVISHVAD